MQGSQNVRTVDSGDHSEVLVGDSYLGPRPENLRKVDCKLSVRVFGEIETKLVGHAYSFIDSRVVGFGRAELISKAE